MNLWSICSPQSVHEVFTNFDHSPAPPHHFNPSGEELENVTSIVLQLGRSDLESPFDGLLPYQDWPLVCWTYAHQLCLANILSWLHAHTPGRVWGSQYSTCMFLPTPSLPKHIRIHLPENTPNVAHFAMFHTMWWSQYVSHSVMVIVCGVHILVQVMEVLDTW